MKCQTLLLADSYVAYAASDVSRCFLCSDVPALFSGSRIDASHEELVEYNSVQRQASICPEIPSGVQSSMSDQYTERAI